MQCAGATLPYLGCGCGRQVGRWAGAVGGGRHTGKVQSGQQTRREDGKVSPVKEGKVFQIVPVFHTSRYLG